MEALLSTRATERLQALRYEPPSSWTKEAKVAFLNLPPDLQIFYVKREKDRDREVRRSQNEAADLRKSLAETQRLLAEAQQALAAIQQKETENDQDTPA